MPTIMINSQQLTFNNIYYVDSINGSDQNSGSDDSPFLTVNYAVSRCATSGDAIYANKGTHDVTRLAGTYDSGGLWDDSKAISFIGVKGQTIFVCDGSKHSGRDTHCIMFRNAGTKAYQITFDFRVGNRTINYSTSICGAGGPVTRGEIINCLFKVDSPSPSFSYSNDGTTTTKFTNCVFDVKANFVGSYTGGPGITLENCITNFTFHTEGTKTNTFDKGSFDSKYHITNFDEIALNVGIYSGKYGWTFDKILLQHNNNKIYTIKSSENWYQTKMTSNIAPAPLVASASSFHSSGYEAYKAFNGDHITDNYWCTTSADSKNCWLMLDFNVPKRFNKVVLKSMITSRLGYNPKEFKIQGSKDNLVFKDLATVNEEWNTETDRIINFHNSTKYRYYKIFIISNNGASWSGIRGVQFYERKDKLINLPSANQANFKKYGGSNLRLDTIFPIISFALQDKFSKNEEGLWVVTLDKKPLAIEFGNKE
ncbi:discoidin domain-containing protein (plasmid) [Lysinibacillus fusiformis]|nr:discoidin domain-containing protein [Lysinibacillus fusiformis]